MVTNIPISCNCTPGPYFYVNCYLVNHMKIYQEVLHTVVSPLFHNDCPNLFLKLDTHAILVLPLPICCLNLTTGIPPPKSSPNNKGSYLYLELEKEGKKSTLALFSKKEQASYKKVYSSEKTQPQLLACCAIFSIIETSNLTLDTWVP